MSDRLVVRGAREHNLRDVSLELPRDQLIVFTGLSGSGKRSLAFDTIYAEGQRRYVESLSAYARQFLGQMDKPDVDFIEGLSPAISIDQKSASRNPRSTVGTITEIYDYLRLLYARVGDPPLPQGRQHRVPPDAAADSRPCADPGGRDRSRSWHPLSGGARGSTRAFSRSCQARAMPAPVDGTVYELAEVPKLARYEAHTIEVVVDRLVLRPGIERRLTDSLETALKLADGVAEVQIVPRDGPRSDAAGGDGARRDGDRGGPPLATAPEAQMRQSVGADAGGSGQAETLTFSPAPGLPRVRYVV